MRPARRPALRFDALLAGACLLQPSLQEAGPPIREPVVDDVGFVDDTAQRDAGFHPAIEAALRDLVVDEVRWNRLTLRHGDGDEEALQTLYVEALDQLPREVVAEFDADHGISPRTIYTMLVTWKADEVFRRALHEAASGRPMFTPDDLLAVLRSPDLGRMPADVPKEVRDFVDEVAARMAPDTSVLSWYPSVAYLAFAALHSEVVTDDAAGKNDSAQRFWSDDPELCRAQRSGFIRSLLELAATADEPRRMTRIVDEALAPPLEVRHLRNLVTCCRAEFARHRGRVGFDRDHLEFVSRFLRAEQEAGRADAMALRVDGSRLDPFMPPPPTVAGFMAMMRLRILLELDPRGPSGPAALRFGTTAEVEAWYRAMFEERGWQNFWAEAGPDVERILAGTFPDLRDARIDELSARLGSPALPDENDDERERIRTELRGLELARAGEQEHLAGVVLQLFASAGEPDLVKSELLRLDPGARPGDWSTTLAIPWLTLLQRDASWVDELIDQQLGQQLSRQLDPQLDTRRGLPKPALEAALLEVRRRCAREGDTVERARDIETLVAIGCDGPTDVRGCAFFEAASLPQEAARRLYDRALADAAAPDDTARGDAGRRLFRPMVELLFERRGESWTHAALLDTFDHEGASLWRGDYLCERLPFGPLAQKIAARERELLAWLATELSDDEFAQLERTHRIPARIRDERARLRAGGQSR